MPTVTFKPKFVDEEKGYLEDCKYFIQEALWNLRDNFLQEDVKKTRELSLVMTKLEEAIMWLEKDFTNKSESK